MKYEINKKQDTIGLLRLLWRVFVLLAIISLAFCYGNYRGELYGFQRTKEFNQHYKELSDIKVHNALNDRDAWKQAYESCKQDRTKC